VRVCLQPETQTAHQQIIYTCCCAHLSRDFPNIQRRKKFGTQVLNRCILFLSVLCFMSSCPRNIRFLRSTISSSYACLVLHSHFLVILIQECVYSSIFCNNCLFFSFQFPPASNKNISFIGFISPFVSNFK
jgi:hypothetical protein